MSEVTALVPGAEAVSLVAPIGIRFVDVASGGTIVDGLDVTLTVGTRTEQVGVVRGGFMAAARYPGRANRSFGRGDDDWWSNVTTAPAALKVIDRRGRYVPYRYVLDVPNRGLVEASCAAGSPLGSLSRVLPLFPAAGYVAPSGVAVVRAQLVRQADEAPAGFSLLAMRPAVGTTPLGTGEGAAVGLADARGRVVVGFPWPAPAVNTSLIGATWSLTAEAHFDPSVADNALNDRDGVPDLCSCLGQPARALLDADANAFGPFDVTYGEERDLGPNSPYHLLVTT